MTGVSCPCGRVDDELFVLSSGGDRRQALDRLAAAQERIAALLTDQPAKPDQTANLRFEAPRHR
jgi:hypothetical protein